LPNIQRNSEITKIQIIRNQLKIRAAVSNVYLRKVQEELQFQLNIFSIPQMGIPIIKSGKSLKEVPANFPLSDEISKD
jgi:3-methyladenine DNA glycosylase Tag